MGKGCSRAKAGECRAVADHFPLFLAQWVQPAPGPPHRTKLRRAAATRVFLWGPFRRSRGHLHAGVNKLVSIHKSVRILADLLINADYELVDADAINPCVPGSRADRRPTRDVKQATCALKVIVVNRFRVCHSPARSCGGGIHDGIGFDWVALVLPNVPRTIPELFSKDNDFHWHPLCQAEASLFRRIRSPKRAQEHDFGASSLMARCEAQA